MGSSQQLFCLKRVLQQEKVDGLLNYFRTLKDLEGRAASEHSRELAVQGRGLVVRSQDHGDLQKVQLLLFRRPWSNASVVGKGSLFISHHLLPCGRPWKELSNSPTGHQCKGPGKVAVSLSLFLPSPEHVEC